MQQNAYLDFNRWVPVVPGCIGDTQTVTTRLYKNFIYSAHIYFLLTVI
jgi:hypothetical protein